MSTPTLKPHTSFDSFDSHVQYIRYIVDKCGPDEDEYAEHLAWYSCLNSQIESGQVNADERNRLREMFGAAYTAATMHGHAHVQPLGYAGDYKIIEKIYDSWISPEPELEKYDLFFHRQQAPIAVRNRKQYFQDLITEHCRQHQQPMTVLNLASGPCFEIRELFDREPSLPVRFLCVDVDENAVRRAKEVVGEHNDKVSFVVGNIFRFKPTDKYSLIWSAGLFDYFDDRTFWRILKRFIPALQPDGEVVVGNFGDSNPTKGYMEALATWYLCHRSDEQLSALAKQAGATSDKFQIRVGFEPTRVNRFLHISRSRVPSRIDPQHGLAGPKAETKEMSRDEE